MLLHSYIHSWIYWIYMMYFWMCCCSVPLVYQNFLSKRCGKIFGFCWVIFRPELWGHVAPMSVPRWMRWNQLILLVWHLYIWCIFDCIGWYFILFSVYDIIWTSWSLLYSGMGCFHRNGPRCVCVYVCMYIWLVLAENLVFLEIMANVAQQSFQNRKHGWTTGPLQ